MIKNKESEITKEEKKAPNKGGAQALQKTDWGKKIKEYSIKGINFIKDYALQVVMVVASIILFNFVITYFSLTVMQGLMVFGGIALIALIFTRIMDGSASQALEKVQTKLNTPAQEAA